jgi:pyruvate dehydrogenase E1 component alpha subunit
MSALNLDDTLTSTHRGHGHALAKGLHPDALFHEILGNDEGPCHGRGGSMHVADFSKGMLGANGIVAASVPIAMGSALAHKTLGNSRVAVAFFGDGALAEGVIYETMNLAALWSLPLLLVCENNGWSEFSPSSAQYAGSLEALTKGFGATYRRVDGNDVEAVADVGAELVTALRAGKGPAVLECVTTRVSGHYEGDPQAYRKGLPERETKDPIELVLTRMKQASTPADRVAAAAKRVAEAIDGAAAAAVRGHAPEFDAALADVYA